MKLNLNYPCYLQYRDECLIEQFKAPKQSIFGMPIIETPSLGDNQAGRILEVLPPKWIAKIKTEMNKEQSEN